MRAQVSEALLPALVVEGCFGLEADGGRTIKDLWRLYDGAQVESVLMRYPQRTTLCVSSQAGCGMACPFCATGQMGLTRNLSTAEIVESGSRGTGVVPRWQACGWAYEALERRLHGHGRASRQLQDGCRRASPFD